MSDTNQSWSASPPTVDGMYWLRRKGWKDTVVEVRNAQAEAFRTELGIIDSDSIHYLQDEMKRSECMWFGPIPAPA